MLSWVPYFFNIYLNDIFFFVQNCDVANYVDDTTPYTIDGIMDTLLQFFNKDTTVLVKWFKDSYLQTIYDEVSYNQHNKDIS